MYFGCKSGQKLRKITKIEFDVYKYQFYNLVLEIFTDIGLVMEGQQYSFSWANHSKFAPNTFRDLFGVEAFSDVTLACSDDNQLYAHRIILSSCSPFFRHILLKNPHKNTVIYLKGISSTEMQAILKFVYQGSCEVGVDDLKGFLEAGKELKIEGLQDDAEQRNVNESSWPLGDSQYDLVEDSIHSELFYSEKQEVVENKTCQPRPIHNIETNFDSNYAVQIFSKNKGDTSLETKAKCFESKTCIGIQCNECSYNAPGYINLKKHKGDLHENNENVISNIVKCKECDFTALDNPNLRQHDTKCSKNVVKETRTETMKKRYVCDRCDYQANFATNFKKHMESTHKTNYNIFKWNKNS